MFFFVINFGDEVLFEMIWSLCFIMMGEEVTDIDKVYNRGSKENVAYHNGGGNLICGSP